MPCSNLLLIFPFFEWYNELYSITENEEMADEKDLKIINVAEKDVFTVKNVPLYSFELDELQVGAKNIASQSNVYG